MSFVVPMNRIYYKPGLLCVFINVSVYKYVCV